ncbi:flagellin [Acidisphaera sp. S103]|uniref:flagellin n=1 Tax=Acidisphaera sp. S103 TaxID=1747223 RepID=UPI00131C82E4|nr:flagellin [Acidisphaera sp. S103]
MSSTIGTGYGILPTLIANSTSVHQQLDTLTEQASTGLVSQTYAGLGGEASVSLNLNPQLTALQTYQNDIGQATGSMSVTQTTMTQIQQIASTFAADIPDLNSLNASEVDSVAAQANAALQQVAGLLDTQDGNNYVFGGQDSTNPPVPSPDDILSSGFYTQINAAVSALSVNGATATAASTLSIASSNAAGTSPFSAYMSQPASAISPPVVQTGEGGTVQTGLLASANSVAVSSGTSTTGSYMRDLMRALATLGSLSSSQVNDTGFAALVQDTGTSLTGVVSAMATDVGVLGSTQANLTATQTQLSDTATALTGQLSSVQNVNMAQTISSLTSMQTQLQASYRLISGETSLSLVNFLPTTTG